MNLMNKRKEITIILLIVVIGLLVIYGGVSYFQNDDPYDLGISKSNNNYGMVIKAFENYDYNKNDLLDLNEITAIMNGNRTLAYETLNIWDTNNDGTLSPNELFWAYIGIGNGNNTGYD